MSRTIKAMSGVVWTVAWLTTLLSPGALAQHAAAQRRLSIDDLYLFDQPSAAALSPRGEQLAYVRQWIDPHTREERSSLWLVEGHADHARPLEANEPDARGPVFSPDGEWIAFRSTRARPEGWQQTPLVPPESDPATDIWLIRTRDGAALPLAGSQKPYGRVLGDAFYGRLAFSPDGQRLAFVADEGKDPRSPAEIEADVYVVRPDQGEGYTGYGAAQVWVAYLDAQPQDHAATRIERLTYDAFWYGDPQWSPDGRTIAVHANRTQDQESVRFSINKNYDLWAIDVANREMRQLTKGPGPEVSPRFSPNGQSLACLSSPRQGPHADVFNLAIVTLGAKKPETRIVFDHHGSDADHDSHPAPAFPLPDSCWRGDDQLAYDASVGTKSARYGISLATARVAALSQDPDDLRRSKLTPAGNGFLRQRVLGESRLIQWTNDDLQLEGVLTTPPESAARPPYKLVVFPHGGPHSRSTMGFNFTAEVFAAHGYAVFQPNFRGSQGYGRAFLDADRQDLGGGDMRDILAGIEHLIQENLVDRQRQFVYGVSYGGFMTSWLVGHTHQFRAAVAQNAVTDLNAMWGLSDLQSWTEWEFAGRPWEVPKAMRQHSPITYAAEIKTPTLVLHSREDRRCPIAMGLMFYQSLRARGVPTQMVVYPHEGHGIRQPRHRADVLRRALAWFAQHEGTDPPRP